VCLLKVVHMSAHAAGYNVNVGKSLDRLKVKEGKRQGLPASGRPRRLWDATCSTKGCVRDDLKKEVKKRRSELKAL
jgi:hypothetical protein